MCVSTGHRLTFARRSLPATIALAALAGPLAIGMQTAPPLSFEAASITPLKSGQGPFHFTVLPNRLDVKNLSLGFLIREAYDLAAYQLSGPDRSLDRRFDIAATSGKPVSKADMRAMLQSLLIERFHLATHWQTQTETVYRLVTLPGGPKMKLVDAGYALPNSPLRDGGSIQIGGPMSMRQLSERLAGFAGKPVVDATSLEGYFSIQLTFAAEDYDPSQGSGSAAPLLPKAVEQQLGLKLAPAKEPVRILVVDHVDATPLPN